MINNENFGIKENCRAGSQHDVERLKKVFGNLKFEVNSSTIISQSIILSVQFEINYFFTILSYLNIFKYFLTNHR
jgi:hypothetical protein